MKKFSAAITVLFLLFVFHPSIISAHEAYVLTRAEFQKGLATTTSHPLAGLLNPRHIGISIEIMLGVIFLYLLALIFATTPFASFLDRILKKATFLGPLIIRLAISASFFYAAFANAILGPELSLTTIAGGPLIRFLLFTLSIMIFLGFFTELAAAIGLGIFFYITYTFQAYMITYANYFGELLVLLLFGSRFLSLDLLFFGEKAWLPYFEQKRFLEIPIVRILYGIALMYAGWTIKFMHQGLSIAVYNQYHLHNFFHASARFIAAGAGVSEIAIGLFILLGFAQRLTVIISLFFITLSIFYFREMLWPHFMLYGISFSLFINSADQCTLDRYIVPLLTRITRNRKNRKKRK